MKKIYILVIVAVTLISGSLFYLFSTHQNSNKTEKVEKKRFVKSVYASGYVDSENKVLLKPEVSGYVEEIHVDERDRVDKNQLLAVISNEKINENLAEVRVKKQLAAKRMNDDSDYLKALRDEIEIQKLNMEIEKNSLVRRIELYKKGIISKESFERAERSYEVSEKSLRKSIEDYNDKKDTIKADYDSFESQENAILEEIKKHNIVSPVNGEILRKMVEEGDYINHLSPDSTLFSIGNRERLETVLYVDEEYLPLIKLGQKVLISSDAYPDRIFEGNVVQMELESDRRTRTVIVKADVEYPQNIPVGVTIEANIILDDREGLFIKKNYYKGGKVQIVDKNKAREVKVETGVRGDEYLEITEGVRENQEIISR